MLKCKTKCGSFLVCSSVIILYLMQQQVTCSEFPDRECCDEKLPRIIESETMSSQSPVSTTTTLTTQTPIAASTLKPGSNIRTAIAILNCILARQLCFEDPSCSAILEIIPRVCGPIPVACSTVTVTKCQAALRTLQAFPFFRPTCLCKEPGVDPDCNSFRDFLFDHPCGFVLKKEKDPYPIDALPTCNHALSVCQQERKCIKLFEEFKSHCKVRDNKCRMEDRELCHESWTNLRLSPMFGCICPNNHMKRRCDRIFSIVNHNPCIVRSMGMDESYYQTIFDDNIALIETPLTAPPSIHYSNHHNAPSYPYNLSAFQGGNSAVDNLLVDNASSKQHSMDVPRDGTLDIIKLHFQSNCHTALITCREDPACNTALQPVLSQCELHRCNRNACMSALQAFYQGSHEDISLDIAFCFCKKTNDRHDACMSAQEKLHPTCAQRPSEIKSSSDSNGVFYLPPPACNVVANMCKENADCRKKLEYYEQACAIDSVTKKCAGKSSVCRQAVLGILGTSLRIACVCQTGDLQNMYECLAWQRLLWSNACVVDSQKDFYTKRLAELGLLATRPPPVITEVTVASGPVTSNWLPQDPNTIYQPAHSHMTDPVVTEMPIEIDYMGSNGKAVLNVSNDLNSVLQNGDHNTSTGKENGFTRDKIQELIEDTDMQYPPTTTEATESLSATMSTTMTTVITTTMTTTTQAPKNCVVQRPYQQDQLIPEGSSRRIYSLDDVECSELCICGESLILTCHALCVPFAPCRTALAFYNHASPAYQAFRGRCLCYSGQFICMRPPPGEYYLPGGVFLLLGYSATDEALLRPHTNLGVRDAVRALQEYVTTYIDNKTQCVLTLFNMTDQNIIISARLPNDPQLNAYELLQKEKEECSSVLESLSQLINTEYSELQAHRLLSIFKMAEVQVVWYETNNSIRSALHFCNIEIYSMLVISVIPYSTWLITNINFKLT